VPRLFPDGRSSTLRTQAKDRYGLPQVLKVAEAAVFLGLERKTVYAAIKRGDLPARRVGRRVVILRDVLLRWLASEERVVPERRGR
jgi:excisionase family DNA binding protein